MLLVKEKGNEYGAGRSAYYEGKSLLDNPHRHMGFSFSRRRWEDGWLNACRVKPRQFNQGNEYGAGRSAYYEGKSLLDNPHRHGGLSFSRRRWEDGWLDAYQVKAEQFDHLPEGSY